MIKFIIPFATSVATPERPINLLKCVEQLNKAGVVPLIVSNNDPDIKAYYDFIRLDTTFNKAQYLNFGISNIKEDKFFALDSDIYVPLWFPKLSNKIIENGTAYFPICYGLNKDKPMSIHLNREVADDEFANAHGMWFVGGYGLMGVTKSDWEKYDFALDNNIGKTYGMEDSDIHLRLKTKIRIVRHKCPGLFHMWHPKSLSYKTANYDIAQDGEYDYLGKRHQFYTDDHPLIADLVENLQKKA